MKSSATVGQTASVKSAISIIAPKGYKGGNVPVVYSVAGLNDGAENVFAYPGIGTATTAAALNGDAPLLLGIALISAIFVFVGNLIANILYEVCDPRTKEKEKA